MATSEQMPTADDGPVERVVRPRVLVADDGHSPTLLALLLALDAGDVDVLDAAALKVEPRPLPDFQIFATPKPEPQSYGPPIKGRGGKLRRW